MKNKYVDKDEEKNKINKAFSNAIASMEMEGFKFTKEEEKQLIKKYKKVKSNGQLG